MRIMFSKSLVILIEGCSIRPLPFSGATRDRGDVNGWNGASGVFHEYFQEAEGP